MQLSLYTPTGRKSGTIKLPQQLFAAKINQPLMAQAVRVFLSNQRQASRKVKTRGEVTGSRRKIWRQKGTGRARHGDRYAPIFVGGGKAHGPTGKENFKLKLPKSMRFKALASALTSKVKAAEIVVVKDLSPKASKTKNLNQALTQVCQKSHTSPAKISLILPEKIESLIRSSQNLKKVQVLLASQLNAYQVLNGGTLIFLKPSIDVIKKTYLSIKKNNKKN